MDVKAHIVRLLQSTISHAVMSVPYYAESFKGLDLTVESPEDMRRFPILTRMQLSECAMELLAKGSFPEYVRNTSGTTFCTRSVSPVVRFESEEERLAWLHVMNSGMSASPQVRPLALRLLSIDHGLDIPGAIPGVFAIPLEKPAHFKHICSLLQRTYSFEGYTSRITMLTGSLTLLKLLTLLCFENDIDPRKFSLKYIASHSQKLTKRWRGLLEDAWGADVDEMYGLSEVPGLQATRCSACGFYHFSPLSYVEVLDLSSDKPISIGPGRVIATSYYPLVATQPMIRYDTQDIIDIQPNLCHKTQAVCFEYVGRIHDTIMHPTADESIVLISPMTLCDILDPLPDINTEPNTRAINTKLRNMFGFQKYRARELRHSSGLEIILDTELRWSPLQYPDAAQTLKAHIYNSLLESSVSLASVVANGQATLTINFHDPGSTNFEAEA